MIYYKTKRIEDEFKGDNTIKYELKQVIYMLSLYCELEFGKDVVITELYRTQSEQDFYYKDRDTYQRKPWKSVHQFGRGADIRSRNFTENQITKIIAFLNLKTYKSGSKYQTAIYHNIGMGSHIHIQTGINI